MSCFWWVWGTRFWVDNRFPHQLFVELRVKKHNLFRADEIQPAMQDRLVCFDLCNIDGCQSLAASLTALTACVPKRTLMQSMGTHVF